MRDNVFIAEQFQRQGCVNIDQGVNLWHLLNHVIWADVLGDVVELGCLTGITAAMLGTTLKNAGSSKRMFLYDSFEGLPQPTEKDGKIPFIPENFKTDPKYAIQRFEGLGLPQPTIVKGWFKDTLPDALPPAIAFAHVDGDLYDSTLEGLQAVYPRLSPGAVVVVDDYCDDAAARRIESAYAANVYHKPFPNRPWRINNWVPAVQTACEEFMIDKPEEMTVLIAGDEKHAFFRKL